MWLGQHRILIVVNICDHYLYVNECRSELDKQTEHSDTQTELDTGVGGLA